MGPAGLSKSTLASTWAEKQVLELDRFRAMVSDDETDQFVTLVAVQIQTLLLDARLARGPTAILDSTHLGAPAEAGLLARAGNWQRPTVAVLFDVPLATVEAQNPDATGSCPLTSCVSSTACCPPPASCVTRAGPRSTWRLALTPAPPDDPHRRARQPRFHGRIAPAVRTGLVRDGCRSGRPCTQGERPARRAGRIHPASV
ncbi:AAA family ATPase [Streptomyces sp. 058-1L]|uniref:AAA family ATPase n=1 Tax=Streptomyces sp. 058-1L TaxID=2789266 RepID=UPI003980388D